MCQDMISVVGYQHVVFDPHTKIADLIQTRLIGVHRTSGQRHLIAPHDVRGFMHFPAQSVARLGANAVAVG